MAKTGFTFRGKGKVKYAELWLDFGSLVKGLFDSATASRIAPVWTNAGAPTSGTSGTFVNLAQPGDLLVDTTTGNVYSNGNTAASPTWNQIGSSFSGSGNIALTGTTGSGAGAGGAEAITGGTGGSTSGTGGATSQTGGAGGAPNGAGGAAAQTGGAGTGTGNGGAATQTGGASGTGATGNGGPADVTGGAALSTNGNGGSVVLTPGVGNGTGVAGGVRAEGVLVKTQGAPTAATTSATLTAAALLSGIITVLQGGGANSAQQLPTGTALQTALPVDFAVNDSFDFSVINISSSAGETATITTNTGWTLVGDIGIPIMATGAQSQGLFRARKTATNTFTLYRIA